MSEKKRSAVALTRGTVDPFALWQHMTSELDRAFDDWPSLRWPSFRSSALPASAAWSPKIDVFEKDDRLVTRADLPGLKRDDVSVQVVGGRLVLSGERKREAEEKKDSFYRIEREYGTFYRAVPLPDGVNLEGIKATFADGVLEVSVPLPAAPASHVRQVEVEAPETPAKPAA